MLEIIGSGCLQYDIVISIWRFHHLAIALFCLSENMPQDCQICGASVKDRQLKSHLFNHKKQRHNEIISQGLLLNNSSSINQYDKKMIETDDDFQGRNDAMQDQVEKEENQGPK
jgi:hypothetical protein